MLASRAIMSMALAGVDLFAAIILCSYSERATSLWFFLLATCIATLLLAHAFVSFFLAWRRRWDSTNLLVIAGFVPALCLAALAVTALTEILRS
jgi:hypothetical protein